MRDDSVEELDIRVLVPEARRVEVTRTLTRRAALLAAAGGSVSLLAACGGSTTKRASKTIVANAPVEDKLVMFNWQGYSDPNDYKRFTRQYHARVVVTGVGSNEEILAKLRAGGSAVDVVVPTGYAVKEMIDQGLAMKLDRSLLPNITRIRPEFTKSVYDPGNVYSVPKNYGITSFYWRTAAVKEDPKTLMDAFEMVMRSPKANVNFLEDSTGNFAMALCALGYSINSEKESELQAAKELLLKAKPNVDTFNGSYLAASVRGDIDIGMGYNGDGRRIVAARKEAGDEVRYMVPEGSAPYWVDNWMIGSGAPHPVAAHKWINMMLSPRVAATEMNFHQYDVPVEGVNAFVDPELVKDPLVVIPDSLIARYQTQLLTPNSAHQRSRLFNEVKAA